MMSTRRELITRFYRKIASHWLSAFPLHPHMLTWDISDHTRYWLSSRPCGGTCGKFCIQMMRHPSSIEFCSFQMTSICKGNICLKLVYPKPSVVRHVSLIGLGKYSAWEIRDCIRWRISGILRDQKLNPMTNRLASKCHPEIEAYSANASSNLRKHRTEPSSSFVGLMVELGSLWMLFCGLLRYWKGGHILLSTFNRTI